MVCARSLLYKANNFFSKLNSLKQFLSKVSKILKGFNILIEETRSGIDDLNQAVNIATKADNVKTNKQKVEDVSEQIVVEPDIYFDSRDSNSLMETQEVECIDLTTDTDSETSEASVDKLGRCIEKERKPAKGNPDSMVLLH